MSIDNCYSAIEVYSFKNFEQVAELAIRIPFLTHYSDIVLAVTEYYYQKTGGRIILCIENNSIGHAVVESVIESDYVQYLYHERGDVDKNGLVTKWGVSTTGKTKPLMISEAFAHINDHPNTFHSEDLINQLKALERNNAGQVSSRSYTDMFMGTCFCAYVRKMKELEILPMLDWNNEENMEKAVFEMSTLMKSISPVAYANHALVQKDWDMIRGTDELFGDPLPPEDTEMLHLPFFFDK